MEYKLVFYSYCGMSITIARGDEDTLRSIVAERICRHRKTGRGVFIIKEGRAWEFGEAEDGTMVSDDEGTLWMKKTGGCDDEACKL